tara:strand:+ start:1467 stop:1874 length:408 start_codon:yes stop_codon:yes gene_type:complete
MGQHHVKYAILYGLDNLWALSGKSAAGYERAKDSRHVIIEFMDDGIDIEKGVFRAQAHTPCTGLNLFQCQIFLGFDGSSPSFGCNCPDFHHNGKLVGACSHILALGGHIEALISGKDWKDKGGVWESRIAHILPF